MVSNCVEYWRVGENFLHHIVNPIHNFSVASLGRFPNSVVDDVAGVINCINDRMSFANSTECVFDCLPWSIAVLQGNTCSFELSNSSISNQLLYNHPIDQQHQPGPPPCRRFFDSKLGSGNDQNLLSCNVDRSEDQSSE